MGRTATPSSSRPITTDGNRRTVSLGAVPEGKDRQRCRVSAGVGGFGLERFGSQGAHSCLATECAVVMHAECEEISVECGRWPIC